MSQIAALSNLAKALDDTFDEALVLLPQMIRASRAKQPLPRRNPAIFDRVCAALSFIENGKPRFLTLAHLAENETLSYRTQETLVWIAIETATCGALEDNASAVKRERGFFGRFRGQAKSEQTSPISTAANLMLMRNTQSIAIRASYLATFARLAMEHMAHTTASNVFDGSMERARRYMNSFQDQIDNLLPYLIDKDAAINHLKSLSMPSAPVIITQTLNDACDNLNGIPLTREHASAWRDYLGRLQGSAVA